MPKKNQRQSVTDEESAFDLIVPSFKGFWINIVPFTFVTLASMAVMMLAARYQYDFSQLLNGIQLEELSDPRGFFVWLLMLGVVSFITFCMEVHIALKSAARQQTDIGEALHVTARYLFRLVGFSIVFGVAVVCGLILLIIPGLIVIKRYALTPFYIIDKDLSLFEAMKQSAADTRKPNNGLIWGVMGVAVIFLFFSFILGGIDPKPLGTIVGSLLVSAYGVAFPIRYLQIKHQIFDYSKKSDDKIAA